MGRFSSVDPSGMSIQLNSPQSWNRYSYTYNNPLVLVDDNGKWPTSIHERIIDNAFFNLSRSSRAILKRVSRDMDGVFNCGQCTNNAYQHGMRAPGQTVEEAAKKASDFIGAERDKARQLQAAFENNGGNGLSKEALEAFGKALHTIIDMTSPAHEGFQVWYGLPVPGDPQAGHDAYEAEKHREMESTITYGQLGYAVGAAVQFFYHTFGNERGDQATAGTSFGSESDPNVQQIRAGFALPGSDPRVEGEALYAFRLTGDDDRTEKYESQ